MGRKAPYGTCHICGATEKLSFEHVPPRSAFNDRPIVQAEIDRLIEKEGEKDYLDRITGPTKQKGAGAYTLCVRCNNVTGQWYGSAYQEWAYQGLKLANYTRIAPSLLFTFKTYPLRVLKQIICMFFSSNGEGFRLAHPELVKFALNKKEKYVYSPIRSYAYYNLSGRSRQSGVVGGSNIRFGS